jgi:ketosteroid isomerase-like protein
MDDIVTTGQQWAAAEAAGDAGALADLVTDDFRLVGPVGFVLDRQQYLGRYQGGFSPESVEWDDVTVRDYGTAAITIATVTQKATFAGQRTDGQFRVTHVFVKPGDRWQVANAQYSMIGGPPPFARPGA